MKDYIKIGLGFGITSATVTTLALMVGLYASTQSRLAVLSGILVIAVADALSDAFGIHISQESRKEATPKDVWVATVSAFLSKLFFALTFVISVLLFRLELALVINMVWGVFLLTFLSAVMAKSNGQNAVRSVLEHLTLAVFAVGGSYLLGELINQLFV